jgi:twitching motility protein PilT
MELNDILKLALQKKASDIHLKAGLPPVFRIHGELVPQTELGKISPEGIEKMLFGIMSPMQKERFKKEKDLDMAYGVAGLGRFRVNIFQQRGTLCSVFRAIPMGVPSISELNLPKIIEKLAMEERGLIIVTGTTGSGKSTTLASMIDFINSRIKKHIITIEDPIEYLLRDKNSIINQREIGTDTVSFVQALRAALREDPDVIMVGEMRDKETIETALLAAETGHLVLSTLHTLDATETINRIISVFPPHQHRQIRIQLASVLKGVISQRLIQRADKKGRVPAVEVMINTALIRECIIDKDRTKEIRDVIAKGYTTYGMQTFDQSLLSLYTKGLITYEEAMRNATNPDDLALRIKGVASSADLRWEDFEVGVEEDKEEKI